MAQTNSTAIVKTVEDVYAKLPALPKGGRDFLYTVAPWVALIFGILSVLGSLSAFGLSAVFSPFAAMGGSTGFAAQLLIASALGVVEGVLMVVSFPSLRKGVMKGWTLLFWAEVLGIVGSVVLVSVGGVIGGLIGLYLLFQIKSYYK